MAIVSSPLSLMTAVLRASRGRPLDVLGVGEISHDLVLQLPPPTALREPLPDKLSAQALTTLGGGQVATAMVAARRLGLRAGLCGAVGEDAAGRELLAELAAEGVELGGVAVCAQAQTRLALVLVDAHGDRRVLEWRHPRLQPRADEPTAADVSAARAVHLDGTYPQASLRAARLAKAAGTLVSIDLDRVLDPGVDLAGAPGRAVDSGVTAELVALADLCVVSARFPTELTAEPDPDRAALRLAARTSGFVVVTRGEAGAVAVIGGTLHAFPALRPPVLLDTTACGDTFHAALLAYLIGRVDEDPAGGPEPATALTETELASSALRFASAAAALKCGALGRRGCPTRAQVDQFLGRAPLEAARV